MARALSEAEALAFLSAGTRTGKLAVVRGDGSAIVQPIWFLVDSDGTLVFNTGRETTKGRALLRDPRLSIVVDEETMPYGFVRVDGIAELSEDPELMLTWATRIAARYVGEPQAAAYGRRNAVPGELLVRVRPTRIVAQAGVAD